jgi:hypothetical protein
MSAAVSACKITVPPLQHCEAIAYMPVFPSVPSLLSVRFSYKSPSLRFVCANFMQAILSRIPTFSYAPDSNFCIRGTNRRFSSNTGKERQGGFASRPVSLCLHLQPFLSRACFLAASYSIAHTVCASSLAAAKTSPSHTISCGVWMYLVGMLTAPDKTPSRVR